MAYLEKKLSQLKKTKKYYKISMEICDAIEQRL